MQPKTQRLDVALVERGLIATRSRARDLIARGLVLVAGRVAIKAGQLVADSQTISIDATHRTYVSRGAEKLVAALDRFGPMTIRPGQNLIGVDLQRERPNVNGWIVGFRPGLVNASDGKAPPKVGRSVSAGMPCAR